MWSELRKLAQSSYLYKWDKIVVPVEQIKILDEISDHMTMEEMKQIGELQVGDYVIGDMIFRFDGNKINIIINATAKFNYTTGEHEVVNVKVVIPEKPKSRKEIALKNYPVEQYPGADKELIELALQATKSLPMEAMSDIDGYQQGVVIGYEGPIDRLVKEKYDLRNNFESVRDWIRKKYGNEVIMYRAEDIDESRFVKDKPVLAFTMNPRLALDFLYDKGRILRKTKVPVDAIWAAIRTTERPLEFLVETNKIQDVERIPFEKIFGRK